MSSFAPSAEACPHLFQEELFRTPANGTAYTDDCALCFADALRPSGGLLTCVTCHVSYCPAHLSLHQRRHADHSIAMRSVARFEKKDEDTEKEEKVVDRDVVCTACSVTFGDAESSPIVPQQLRAVVKALTSDNASAAVQDTVEAHHLMNLKMDCPHWSTIEKTNDAVVNASAACQDCGLDGNSWLCLQCGYVGCGREETGGKGHARGHAADNKHHLVVKLGTITPECTADVWCYGCNDEVLDYALKEHLLMYGIDPTLQTRTVKTLAELELDMNSKIDFLKITEEGKDLVALRGPGLTGLENLGNTCYMASALQVLFSSTSFQNRYRFGEAAAQHHATCTAEKPTECATCQILKLGHGMLSGAYTDPRDPICPRQFKKLWCRNHPAFKGTGQQDVDEFLRYFLSEVHKKEHSGGDSDPTSDFEIHVQNKQVCDECAGVKISTEVHHTLGMRIPVEAPPVVFGDDGKPVRKTAEQIEAERPRITFFECLASLLQPGSVTRHCHRCGKNTNFTSSFGITKFPKYLLVVAQRFVWDRTVMDVRKLDAYIDVEGEETDFDLIRAEPVGASEYLLPIDPPTSSAQQKSDVAVDELSLVQLLSMGIDQKVAEMALRNTDNNVERAIDWVFSHPEAMVDAENAEATSPAPIAAPAPPVVDMAPAGYDLFGLISHIGTSTQSGHYVAHLKKAVDGGSSWVLFNDAKVAKSEEPPKSLAYVYAFVKK